MGSENKLFARVEIYRILTEALIKKTPLPPEDWSVVKFDEEVFRAGREYDPDLHSRHRDALCASVFYLVDFVRRMRLRELSRGESGSAGEIRRHSADFEKKFRRACRRFCQTLRRDAGNISQP